MLSLSARARKNGPHYPHHLSTNRRVAPVRANAKVKSHRNLVPCAPITEFHHASVKVDIHELVCKIHLDILRLEGFSK